MEEVEVEILSREDIKPSSPTPSHLRNFKLCLLDHLIPAPYAPIILFYASSFSPSQIPKMLHLLKHSLSHTLTLFYPLAGKLKDDFSIECNDEGANFAEAHVNCSLSDFLTHPDLISLHKLLPCDPMILKESYVGTHVSNIQVNVFDCGGIAIGVCISHRVLDGAALSNFLKVWTSNCKEVMKKKKKKPELLVASCLFPMNGSLWLRDSSMAMWGSLLKKGKCVTRRFWFSKSAIANLKVQIIKSSLCDYYNKVKEPTSVETVSAILWKSFMAASKAQNSDSCNNNSSHLQRASLVSHAVNLRTRIKHKEEHDDDLYAENAIGNLLWLAFAKSNTANEDESKLDGLLRKLRTAISKINVEYVENLSSDINEKSIRRKEPLKALLMDDDDKDEEFEVDYLGFSSWCNFGFYEVDFGWGKPTWVSSIGSCGSVFMNLAILVDAWFGDGIEAWVSLDQQCMAHVEANPELLAFAIVDPSPLAVWKLSRMRGGFVESIED